MNPAMWISKTGVQAQDAKLQAIANNLANVNTVGFKRDRVVFEDLFYQVEQQPGAQRADNTPVAVGRAARQRHPHGRHAKGVYHRQPANHRPRARRRHHRQRLPAGASARTAKRPTPAPASCRSMPTACWSTPSGLPLVPQITVPGQRHRASPSVKTAWSRPTMPGNTAATELGQLTLTSFINPTGLLALGENLFQETAASGAPTEGKPGRRRPGQAQARRAGRLERAGGRRDGRHDRRPAHLRNEHQGAVGGRQYAAIPGASGTLMQATRHAIAVLLAAVLLAGCASRPAAPVRRRSDRTSRRWRSAAVGRGGVAGGVFNADAGLSLTSDSRAFRVGDVVTVALQETTQASKKRRHQHSTRVRRSASAPPTCSARPSPRPASTCRPTATSPATPPAPSKMRCPARSP